MKNASEQPLDDLNICMQESKSCALTRLGEGAFLFFEKN